MRNKMSPLKLKNSLKIKIYDLMQNCFHNLFVKFTVMEKNKFSDIPTDLIQRNFCVYQVLPVLNMFFFFCENKTHFIHCWQFVHYTPIKLLTFGN